MDPPLVTILDGKKFMWDGGAYGAREDAEKVGQAYRADAFEVQLVEHEGKYLLYTRRAVKQAMTQ